MSSVAEIDFYFMKFGNYSRDDIINGGVYCNYCIYLSRGGHMPSVHVFVIHEGCLLPLNYTNGLGRHNRLSLAISSFIYTQKQILSQERQMYKYTHTHIQASICSNIQTHTHIHAQAHVEIQKLSKISLIDFNIIETLKLVVVFRGEEIQHKRFHASVILPNGIIYHIATYCINVLRAVQATIIQYICNIDSLVVFLFFFCEIIVLITGTYSVHPAFVSYIIARCA